MAIYIVYYLTHNLARQSLDQTFCCSWVSNANFKDKGWSLHFQLPGNIQSKTILLILTSDMYAGKQKHPFLWKKKKLKSCSSNVQPAKVTCISNKTKSTSDGMMCLYFLYVFPSCTGFQCVTPSAFAIATQGNKIPSEKNYHFNEYDSVNKSFCMKCKRFDK